MREIDTRPSHRTWRTALCAAATVWLAAIACVASPAPTSPLPTNPSTPTPAAPTTRPPTALPPPSPTALTVEDAPLSTGGPWLLLEDAQRLWAVNPDGTGLTLLSEAYVDAYRGTHARIAPHGGHVSFITQTAPLRGLTLNVLELPKGEPLFTLPLTSAQTEPDGPPRPVLSGGAPLHGLWGPEGEWLLISARSGLYAVRAPGFELVQVAEDVSCDGGGVVRP